jgi:hypothetical protein
MAFSASAAAASGAQAAAWYAGTTATNGTLLTASEPFKVEVGPRTFREGAKISLETRIGTTRVPVRIVGTGIEVTGSQPSQLYNDLSPAARSKATLKLTGLRVVEPSTCAVQSESKFPGVITTNALNTSLKTVSGNTYEIFRPESGSVLFGYRLVNNSGTCPIPGLYAASGNIGAEAPGIGTSVQSHELVVTPATETAAGTAWTMVGAEQGVLEASVVQTLTSGKYWYAQ